MLARSLCTIFEYISTFFFFSSSSFSTTFKNLRQMKIYVREIDSEPEDAEKSDNDNNIRPTTTTKIVRLRRDNEIERSNLWVRFFENENLSYPHRDGHDTEGIVSALLSVRYLRSDYVYTMACVSTCDLALPHFIVIVLLFL